MTEIIEITVEEVKHHKSRFTLIDVREPHELLGPEGSIEAAILAPLGPALLHFFSSADPNREYVFICLSGVRSASACALASDYGFSKAYNMKGGMLAWNASSNNPI